MGIFENQVDIARDNRSPGPCFGSNTAFGEGRAIRSLHCVLAAIFVLASWPAAAQNNFRIVREFHQPAAPNVERADITIINCQSREYYIYRYYRSHGPNYRAIIPGRWGNPLGGRDHHTFDSAVKASCNW